ncbi:MAG TPA: NlpC/P60 family protein [Mycobacteriales bacterium]|nr:NlpC/P60 family protein [Mycobacteriales bacterium]
MPQPRLTALAAALAAVVGTAAYVAVSAPGGEPLAAAAGTFTVANVSTSEPTPTATGSSTAVPSAPLPKALVAVSVAEVWGGRHKVRPYDTPALQRPAHIGAWLRDMTFFQRSHLFKRLATQVKFGEQVEVLGTWGDLTHIQIPDQTGGRFPDGIIGWIASRQLVAQPADWDIDSPVATVTDGFATVSRTVAGRDRPLTVSYATSLPVLNVGKHQVVVAIPGPVDRGTLPRNAVSVHQPGTPAIAPSARQVLAQAQRFLGLPYLWAGMSAWGYDCSGLTSAVYSQLGITLPRDAADQSLVGKQIPRSQLRVGDLVFFSHTPKRGDIHHVGIYAGHGKLLDAPYTGARVEIVSVRHSYLNNEYWGASRPLSLLPRS